MGRGIAQRARSRGVGALLVALAGLGGCRVVSPELPVSGSEELCCKAAASDNVSFAGCRVARVCRANESVWVRGDLSCGAVEPRSCQGGRCCELAVDEDEAQPEPPPPSADAQILTDPLQIRELPRPVAVPRVLCPGTLERGIVGVVVLQVNVDAAGAVSEVEVRSGIDAECDTVAREALRSAVFKPARDLDGEPIAFALRYEYAFELADEVDPAPAPAANPAEPEPPAASEDDG